MSNLMIKRAKKAIDNGLVDNYPSDLGKYNNWQYGWLIIRLLIVHTKIDTFFLSPKIHLNGQKISYQNRLQKGKMISNQKKHGRCNHQKRVLINEHQR